MRDGMVTQSGRYDEVLKEGTDFDALVSAHNESMELVETEEILDQLAPQSLQRLPSLKEVSFLSLSTLPFICIFLNN